MKIRKKKKTRRAADEPESVDNVSHTSLWPSINNQPIWQQLD